MPEAYLRKRSARKMAVGIKSAVGKRADNQKRRKKRRLYALASIIVVLFIIFRLINSALLRPVIALAEEEARRMAAEVLNDAVLKTVSEYAKSGAVEAFASHRTGEDGASLLFIDAAQLNLMSAEIVDRAQRGMRELSKLGVKLPVGTVSGLPILNGAGPTVGAKLDPVGVVTGSFSSKFSSAGVNQTKYSAFLELKASVRVIFAGGDRTVEVSCRAPILETIVIGDVPQAYTNVDSVDEALNLIPTEVE